MHHQCVSLCAVTCAVTVCGVLSLRVVLCRYSVPPWASLCAVTACCHCVLSLCRHCVPLLCAVTVPSLCGVTVCRHCVPVQQEFIAHSIIILIYHNITHSRSSRSSSFNKARKHALVEQSNLGLVICYCHYCY